MKKVILSIVTIFGFLIVSAQNNETNYLVIQEQGTFAVGGDVKVSPGTFDPIKHGAFNPTNQSTEGQTLHGDHATVFYQIPFEAKELPLVFWHGYGQSMRTWQTTPDGREGYQSIFLKKGFPVYLLDQPRRGLAGQGLEGKLIEARTEDQLWFGIFRMGVGTTFYPDIQFSKDPKALNQFFRQSTPDTGPLDININIDAVSALFDKIGDGILVTHSHSGGQGWLTAIKNDNIKAIVSYEPGSNFVFPENNIPEPLPFVGGTLSARGVSSEEFNKLTKIPIVIYYGDYIPETVVENPAQEQWRASLTMARRWTKAVNDAGGDVTLVVLPEIGIKGNTHFPMSDLNNKQIAELMSDWLTKKRLDKTSNSGTSLIEDIKTLSKTKWQWMADKNVDSLTNLFHEKAKFVHMGGTWGTERELQVIKSGGIWYKKADVHNVSVELFGNTAIVWNEITLLAVVGTNEVTNRFMVTEVYQKDNKDWKLTNLTFSKLL